MRFLVSTMILAVWTAAGIADDRGDAAPWLRYGYTGGRLYHKVVVELFKNNKARVVVVKNSDAPPIEYVTELTPAEATWFRTIVRTTDFSNPDRLEREADGGDGGITGVRASLDGKPLRAKFGRDRSFDNLTRTIFRLVRQAELLRRLRRDHHAYDIRTALTYKTVLQPAAFVEPLETYIQRDHHQLDDALIALASVTTPEHWGGVLAQALEQATDKPYREGSSLSRRQLLLNVITDSPFYLDLRDSHQDALIQIYRLQSAIESAKEGEDAARYVRMFKENEARLKRLKGSD